ncbi:MAG: membrane protein insertion efficiency factor YidD [Candidatus Jacksonbacteria bacterium]|nr:membrane protein insertion efficiency factor YidD [Candidatus Jacksonbacteria bacterium]MBT6034542.1 membrane protein insertion efficiency factor YidD [Candidatus Jacksonbacteria bacterium]MBT6300984.1 membrane protein insertion efficiency factor YidD [Candidatus Jacksonbacteria bacterium]MBT6756902.1 membrane protein insertion efficiency factor YidD [Candidatus Jacksonbacteria bacterium]MBT6955454.1 membrane protein insertion efficiency factor YidD [Candidatus Jacksonbacteria bacterium]
MRKLILLAIRLYQKTLSLDHGPLRFYVPNGQCKFHPTCSEYTYKAVEKYGIVRGLHKGSRRILRCHPWSDGGVDNP